MYGKLVLEVDRRVRLVANQVHSLITANAKKRLAPLLKEFIGPWILAMNDQSKDVARVAQSSFEVQYMQAKKSDIILNHHNRLCLHRKRDWASCHFVKRKFWIT